MSTGGIDWGRTGRGAARALAGAGQGAALGSFAGPIGTVVGGGIGLLLGTLAATDQDRIEQEAMAAEQRARDAGADAAAAAAEATRVREERLRQLIPDAEQRLANLQAGRQDAWQGLQGAQAGQVGAIQQQVNPYDQVVQQLRSRKSPFSPEAMGQSIQEQRNAVAMQYGQGQDALRARLSQRQLGAGAEAAAYSALASQRAMQAAQAELGVRDAFGTQGRAWGEWQQNSLADALRQRDEFGNKRLTDAANAALGNAAGNLNYATAQEGNALARRDSLYGQEESGYRQDATWAQGQQGIQQGAANAGFARAAAADQAAGQGLGNALGGMDLGGVFGGMLKQGPTPGVTVSPIQMPQQQGGLTRKPKQGIQAPGMPFDPRA